MVVMAFFLACEDLGRMFDHYIWYNNYIPKTVWFHFFSGLPSSHTHPPRLLEWVSSFPPERKHGALRPQKPLRLIRDGKVGGSGIFISSTCSLHCHHQNRLRIKVGSCVSHFNVSFIVWAKSQNSVHKQQFLKRRESRSGSNRGPSVHQPSALPLGHTSSHTRKRWR